jgi:hypothetical protein
MPSAMQSLGLPYIAVATIIVTSLFYIPVYFINMFYKNDMLTGLFMGSVFLFGVPIARKVALWLQTKVGQRFKPTK